MKSINLYIFQMSKKDETRLQWQDGVGNIRVNAGEEGAAEGTDNYVR